MLWVYPKTIKPKNNIKISCNYLVLVLNLKI
jgi:hypothetical protein